MLLKTVRLVRHFEWWGETSRQSSIEHSIITGLFVLPEETQVCWLSIYDRPAKNVWRIQVVPAIPSNYPAIKTPIGQFDDSRLDFTLRPYVGKRLYIGVKYES